MMHHNPVSVTSFRSYDWNALVVFRGLLNKKRTIYVLVLQCLALYSAFIKVLNLTNTQILKSLGSWYSSKQKDD